MAGMYPDNKTLAVFGKEVNWPGTGPDGRFTNGSFEDPLVPPSFIPAETLNLVLDNLGGLVAALGRTPDNTSPGQVAAAVTGALAALSAKDGELDAAIAVETERAQAAETALDAAKAPLESPALSGTPTAPTPDISDDSDRIATTAFTHAAAKNDAWPVGSYYTQYPVTGQSSLANMFPSSESPATLFGGTWTEMYAGEKVFFMGGLSSVESNRSAGIQQDAIRNITGRYMQGYNPNAIDTQGPSGTTGVFYWANGDHTASGQRGCEGGETENSKSSFYMDVSRQVPTDSTNHPKNRPIKIWRRTA